MSKSGRYASNRLKVENLTATAKTVDVADCGTIFTVGAAATAVVLPLLSSAGKGWWCRFVVGAADTVQCDITLGAGTITLLNMSVDGTAGAVVHMICGIKNTLIARTSERDG